MLRYDQPPPGKTHPYFHSVKLSWECWKVSFSWKGGIVVRVLPVDRCHHILLPLLPYHLFIYLRLPQSLKLPLKTRFNVLKIEENEDRCKINDKFVILGSKWLFVFSSFSCLTFCLLTIFTFYFLFNFCLDMLIFFFVFLFFLPFCRLSQLFVFCWLFYFLYFWLFA